MTMTNTILLFSPLEQFEFFVIDIFPKNNTILNFVFENTIIQSIFDESEIMTALFSSDYHNKLNKISPIIIETINYSIVEGIENLFILEKFSMEPNLTLWANLWNLSSESYIDYYNEYFKRLQIRDYGFTFFKLEDFIHFLYSKPKVNEYILDVVKYPFFHLYDDLDYPSDYSLAYNFREKEYSDFTVFWLNIYNSIIIVFVLFIFFFVFCNILGNNLNFLNLSIFLIDLVFSFLISTFISLANIKLLKFFPIFAVFFIFIFLSNLTALVPFSFCLTSNLWLTLTLSLSVWVSVTVLAIIVRGFGFVTGFVPSNVPPALKGFITLIEIISYVARAISLGVRIFANMLAGHSLVHILADLVETCVISFNHVSLKIFGIFPALILTFILFIEFGICFLQALVFVILTAIYLNEAFGFNTH